MEKYYINSNTMAILPDERGTKIIEKNKIIYLNIKVNRLIDINCKMYGSSLKGRIEASKYLLGISYKSPIIINEYKEIVMFPTSSLRDAKCIWINYKLVDKCVDINKKATIIFKNNQKLILNISKLIINNQIMKSSLLHSKLKSKKT